MGPPGTATRPAPGSSPAPDHLLRREIGVRQLAATIFNYTVGSGIFVVPALAAAQLGPAAILAYVVCAAIMALMVLCFAEAGSRVSASGGPYAYVELAFGPFVGFLAGVLCLAVCLVATAAVATLFSRSAAALIGTSSPLVPPLFVTAVLAVVAIVNVLSLRQGVRLIEILVVAKLVALIGFVVIGAFFVRGENLAWTSPPSSDVVLGTAGFLVFAFLGIEGALQPSGEVRNPSRTVPAAAILAVAGVAVLYCAVQLVAQGLLGPALAQDRVAPLAAATEAILGPPGRTVMLAAAVVSMFGMLSTAVLAGPRVLFAFGRDGFAPRWLATVHPRYRTPHVAVLVFATAAIVLALTGTWERLVILGNVGALLPYIACAAGAWALRRRDIRADGEPFRTPGGPLVPLLACAAILWVLAETATRTEIAAVAVTLAAAAVIYLVRGSLLRRRRDSLAAA